MAKRYSKPKKTNQNQARNQARKSAVGSSIPSNNRTLEQLDPQTVAQLSVDDQITLRQGGSIKLPPRSMGQMMQTRIEPSTGQERLFIPGTQENATQRFLNQERLQAFDKSFTDLSNQAIGEGLTPIPSSQAVRRYDVPELRPEAFAYNPHRTKRTSVATIKQDVDNYLYGNSEKNILPRNLDARLQTPYQGASQLTWRDYEARDPEGIGMAAFQMEGNYATPRVSGLDYNAGYGNKYAGHSPEVQEIISKNPLTYPPADSRHAGTGVMGFYHPIMGREQTIPGRWNDVGVSWRDEQVIPNPKKPVDYVWEDKVRRVDAKNLAAFPQERRVFGNLPFVTTGSTNLSDIAVGKVYRYLDGLPSGAPGVQLTDISAGAKPVSIRSVLSDVNTLQQGGGGNVIDSYISNYGTTRNAMKEGLPGTVDTLVNVNPTLSNSRPETKLNWDGSIQKIDTNPPGSNTPFVRQGWADYTGDDMILPPRNYEVGTNYTNIIRGNTVNPVGERKGYVRLPSQSVEPSTAKILAAPMVDGKRYLPFAPEVREVNPSNFITYRDSTPTINTVSPNQRSSIQRQEARQRGEFDYFPGYRATGSYGESKRAVDLYDELKESGNVEQFEDILNSEAQNVYQFADVQPDSHYLESGRIRGATDYANNLSSTEQQKVLGQVRLAQKEQALRGEIESIPRLIEEQGKRINATTNPRTKAAMEFQRQQALARFQQANNELREIITTPTPEVLGKKTFLSSELPRTITRIPENNQVIRNERFAVARPNDLNAPASNTQYSSPNFLTSRTRGVGDSQYREANLIEAVDGSNVIGSYPAKAITQKVKYTNKKGEELTKIVPVLDKAGNPTYNTRPIVEGYEITGAGYNPTILTEGSKNYADITPGYRNQYTGKPAIVGVDYSEEQAAKMVAQQQALRDVAMAELTAGEVSDAAKLARMKAAEAGIDLSQTTDGFVRGEYNAMRQGSRGQSLMRSESPLQRQYAKDVEVLSVPLESSQQTLVGTPYVPPKPKTTSIRVRSNGEIDNTANLREQLRAVDPNNPLLNAQPVAPTPTPRTLRINPDGSTIDVTPAAVAAEPTSFQPRVNAQDWKRVNPKPPIQRQYSKLYTNPETTAIVRYGSQDFRAPTQERPLTLREQLALGQSGGKSTDLVPMPIPTANQQAGLEMGMLRMVAGDSINTPSGLSGLRITSPEAVRNQRIVNDLGQGWLPPSSSIDPEKTQTDMMRDLYASKMQRNNQGELFWGGAGYNVPSGAEVVVPGSNHHYNGFKARRVQQTSQPWTENISSQASAIKDSLPSWMLPTATGVGLVGAGLGGGYALSRPSNEAEEYQYQRQKAMQQAYGQTQPVRVV